MTWNIQRVEARWRRTLAPIVVALMATVSASALGQTAPVAQQTPQAPEPPASGASAPDAAATPDDGRAASETEPTATAQAPAAVQAPAAAQTPGEAPAVVAQEPVATAPSPAAAPPAEAAAPQAPTAGQPPVAASGSAAPPPAAAPTQAATASPAPADNSDASDEGPIPRHHSVEAEGWIALRLSVGWSIRGNRSMDLYTTNNTLRARGGGLGIDVWRFGHLLALAVEGDFGFEKAASDGLFGGDFDSNYTQYQGNAGVSARFGLRDIHPWLALVSPHVRVFGSLAKTKQRLADRRQKVIYQTRYQQTFGGGIAAGFSLRTPSLLPFAALPFPVLSLGLRVEAGYGFMDDPEFPLETFDDSTFPVPLHGASLGGLELDAAFLRASLEVRL